jgi:hypothetical protein
MSIQRAKRDTGVGLHVSAITGFTRLVAGLKLRLESR